MAARRAFTLLEAAVAMSIVSLIAIAALGAFGAEMRAASRARELLPAAALARERLGVLDLLTGQTLRMLPDSMTHGDFGPPYQQYHWRASAAEVRSEPGLVEMSVSVEWRDGSFSVRKRRYRPMPTLSRATVPAGT